MNVQLSEACCLGALVVSNNLNHKVSKAQRHTKKKKLAL